jgi:hypothetical protein
MAFSAGGSGVRSDINVTPLIDVVLVLLIAEGAGQRRDAAGQRSAGGHGR